MMSFQTASFVAIVLLACLLPFETVAQPKDSLDRMAAGFIGDFTRAEIKARLDPVMSAYGLEITEMNYERAGRTLAILRKNNGVREMDILDCMAKRDVPKFDPNFQSAATVCAITESYQ